MQNSSDLSSKPRHWPIPRLTQLQHMMIMRQRSVVRRMEKLIFQLHENYNLFLIFSPDVVMECTKLYEGKNKNSNEPTTAKHNYNYALKKQCSEKAFEIVAFSYSLRFIYMVQNKIV